MPPAGENPGRIHLEPTGDEGLDRVKDGLGVMEFTRALWELECTKCADYSDIL